MNLVKSFIIALSLYSTIPVPQFKWEDMDMRFMMCFFPIIGAIIGGVLFLWNYICGIFNIGDICYSFVGTAIPLIITGGFHVDGFMDTMDAFHSYKPKEKKLEILKDSHIGAFSVIMLALYGFIYIGAFSEIKDSKLLYIVCYGFFLSRCLSGISVVTFKSAKKDGLLYQFANSSDKRIVKLSLILQTIACIVLMILQSPLSGVLIALTAILTFIYYYYRTKKELDGITGDTAGYFLLICEIGMIIVAALINVYTKYTGGL